LQARTKASALKAVRDSGIPADKIISVERVKEVRRNVLELEAIAEEMAEEEGYESLPLFLQARRKPPTRRRRRRNLGPVGLAAGRGGAGGATFFTAKTLGQRLAKKRRNPQGARVVAVYHL